MNIVFRVDASIAIGTGHVMRCLTLAIVLRKRGAHIQFITRAHSGHLGDMLVRDGFGVTLLPAPNESKLTGYAAWLGVDQNEDAGQTIEALESQQCDWLVVDHYGIGRAWEVLLQPYTHKMMIIDDLANRSHECDLLLDQNYARCSQERYQTWVTKQCQLLLGPRYALLRSEYAKYREIMPSREGDIKRVLVFMGGSDNANITSKVLDALSIDQLAHLEIDVVIGQNFTHKVQVTEKARARPNTNVYGSLPHLAELMVRADLAIGAGGATMLERLCMGLPSLVLSIAENQVPACEALESSRLIIYLGDALKLDVTAIKSALLEVLAASKHLYGMRNQTLVDGRGADRIAEVLIPTPVANLMLRPANETDVFIYFAWSNDLMTISGEANTELIDISTHLQWFSDRLMDVNSHLYVLEAGNLPIGQVRFEKHELEAIVYYSLDTLVDDRGWKNKLLKLGIEALNKSQPKLFKASTQQENIISAAAFLHLGRTERITSYEEGKLVFSIAVISDQTSWLNDWLPEMIGRWLDEGHRVLWVHQIDAFQSADFCFYLSFSKIVPKSIRALFKNNLVVHESDLPEGKGWSPLTWQILEGKNKIPVTLIEADDKVDSGVVYAQEWIEFEGHELIDELREKQARATMNLCEIFVEKYPLIVERSIKQIGAESFYPRRTPEDSMLDVGSALVAQFNLLRTVDNQRYPAFFECLDYRYEIHIKKNSTKKGLLNE